VVIEGCVSTMSNSVLEISTWPKWEIHLSSSDGKVVIDRKAFLQISVPRAPVSGIRHVQQPAETNASPRKSGKPTRHQRRVVAPPVLAGGDTCLLFTRSAYARFKWSPATFTAAPHTLMVNVLSPLRICLGWLKGFALCNLAPKHVTCSRHIREVGREFCMLDVYRFPDIAEWIQVR